jgi:hypothetical protein
MQVYRFFTVELSIFSQGHYWPLLDNVELKNKKLLLKNILAPSGFSKILASPLFSVLLSFEGHMRTHYLSNIPKFAENLRAPRYLLKIYQMRPPLAWNILLDSTSTFKKYWVNLIMF